MGLGGEASRLIKELKKPSGGFSEELLLSIFLYGPILGCGSGFLICILLHYTVVDPAASYVFAMELCPCDFIIMVVCVATSIAFLVSVTVSQQLGYGWLPKIVLPVFITVGIVVCLYFWDGQMDMYKKSLDAEHSVASVGKEATTERAKVIDVPLYLYTYELPADSEKSIGRGAGVLLDDCFYICNGGKTLVESYYVVSEDIPEIEKAISDWYTGVDYEKRQLTTARGISGYVVSYNETDVDGDVMYASDFAFKYEGAFCVISFLEYDVNDDSIRLHALDSLLQTKTLIEYREEKAVGETQDKAMRKAQQEDKADLQENNDWEEPKVP